MEATNYCVWWNDEVLNKLTWGTKYSPVHLQVHDLRRGDRIGMRLTSNGILSFLNQSVAERTGLRRYGGL